MTLPAGRLSTLRQNSIDNRYLLKTALKIGLDRFSLSDKFKLSGWLPPPNVEALSSKKVVDKKEGRFSEDRLSITRSVGGKALGDTMEALLGAAFSHGGIETALQVGNRLGFAFGGETAWTERFEKVNKGKVAENWIVPPTLVRLVEKLETVGGYRVKNPRLFVQAVTHRSYQLGTKSYEREEFLGDGQCFLLFSLCLELVCRARTDSRLAGQPFSTSSSHRNYSSSSPTRLPRTSPSSAPSSSQIPPSLSSPSGS